jgi:Cd2+/Zn2+-exporting ATPase
VPTDVRENEPVLAGSINLDGHLVVQVTRVGQETTLGKIIALMETAEQAKPPVTPGQSGEGVRDKPRKC